MLEIVFIHGTSEYYRNLGRIMTLTQAMNQQQKYYYLQIIDILHFVYPNRFIFSSS